MVCFARYVATLVLPSGSQKWYQRRSVGVVSGGTGSRRRAREGERELISNRYTVTTIMISALRWASDASHFNVSFYCARAKSRDEHP